MADDPLILAIDQGTTSSRAIVFDGAGAVVAMSQEEFPQKYPQPGWVEHDPEDIWRSTLEVSRSALTEAEKGGRRVVAIGLTNQRETALLWDRRTGEAIHNAIVWQDRRTADICAGLHSDGLEETVAARTGLLLDPYFSATKIAWMLDHVASARGRAESGDLAFGTVDTFLLWRLTGGRSHLTEATNASRTSLFDIHAQAWNDDLLDAFRVPRACLPEVRDSAADFGETDPDLFGRPIPILGIAGDQQAAAIGQGCFAPGAVKSTYGTGAFLLLNTGEEAIASKHRLLTTVAYRLDGKPTYAIEGSIFVAGAAVQWLRDGLGIISNAPETEGLARGISDTGGVMLVPAFTGLGAPHWDPDARGAVYGITRATGPAELARAALESVCFQTHDLLAAMAADGVAPSALRVDGGMVANDWLVQTMADILDIPVDRPAVMETTALGAAYLAGLQAGIFTSLDDIANRWQRDRRFEPVLEERTRELMLAKWQVAIERTTGY
ncbi:MAG: glycerol kinase GlpK [Alphaproteobacteria bacterium]|jgi:glycerol kinase|nr:glycerol kinase GlpK [Alphaproteobacteria bacterium]